MAQTGYTTLSLYYSATPAQAPLNTKLAAGELAINTYDGKLYYKDSSNVVQLLASKNTAAGNANNLTGGSTGSIVYQTSTGVTNYLTLGSSGQVLTAGGSAPQFTNQSALSVGSATNLSGGTSGSVPYQLGTGNTSFLNPATNGQALVLSGGVPAWTNSWSLTQNFTGSTSVPATVQTNIVEPITISATAAGGTVNLYPSTQSVLYYTANATGNWTVNVAWSSGTTLNSALSTGQSVTVAFMATQGSTAYYNTAFQVDGTSTGVTVKYQGSVVPVSGNVNSIDTYTYTIIKTGSATYTVLASQTQFS